MLRGAVVLLRLTLALAAFSLDRADTSRILEDDLRPIPDVAFRCRSLLDVCHCEYLQSVPAFAGGFYGVLRGKHSPTTGRRNVVEMSSSGGSAAP